MELEDIKYYVEYTYVGPDSDYYPVKSKKTFKKMDDVSEFINTFNLPDGYGHWCHNATVFKTEFVKWSPSVVKDMVDSYIKRKAINDDFVNQEKRDAISKLTLRERNILGIMEEV